MYGVRIFFRQNMECASVRVIGNFNDKFQGRRAESSPFKRRDWGMSSSPDYATMGVINSFSITDWRIGRIL